MYVWDIDLIRGQRGPLAVPGTYRVIVELREEQFSKPLQVLRDPYSTGTLADIEAQVAFSLEIRDQISDITDRTSQM